jgi:hypothetical protein
MSDPGALSNWAEAALRAGELREAKRAAQKWALHDGTSAPKLFLAKVLDASGQHTQAKAVLEEWLQVHPDDEEVRATLQRGPGFSKPELAKR